MTSLNLDHVLEGSQYGCFGVMFRSAPNESHQEEGEKKPNSASTRHKKAKNTGLKNAIKICLNVKLNVSRYEVISSRKSKSVRDGSMRGGNAQTTSGIHRKLKPSFLTMSLTNKHV